MIRHFRPLLVPCLLVLAACATPTPAAETSQPVTQASQAAPASKPTIFEGFPQEYQSIQLPPDVMKVLEAGGIVVPLPVDNKSKFIDQLTSDATDPSLLDRFDLSRVVSFESDNDHQYSYIAVPIKPENFVDDFAHGVLVGLIDDLNGAYTGTPGLYQVVFMDESASLQGPGGKEIKSFTTNDGTFNWIHQDSPSMPLTVFVKGSCWGCWKLDSRCGCLWCR